MTELERAKDLMLKFGSKSIDVVDEILKTKPRNIKYWRNVSSLILKAYQKAMQEIEGNEIE